MTTTASRLLRLLSLLQTRRDWPGSVLADRMQVSERTVRRDIDRLRDLGYRIEATMGPDGGYHLGAGTRLPPLLFDDDQAIAVALALRTAPSAGAGIEEGAIRALATIRQIMPARLRHQLDALEVKTVPGPGAPAPVTSEELASLAGTIRRREVLRFDYLARDTDPDAEHASVLRRAEPHHIVTSHGRWYLLGWDLDRDDWRLYRLDRVRPRIPTGPRFTPRDVPGGVVHEFVAARFKGRSTNEWPCWGTVVLDLPLQEVLPFAGDGTVVALDDSRCSLRSGSWSWGALAASYGRFETTMEVVEPPELVAAFAALAARYGGVPPA